MSYTVSIIIPAYNEEKCLPLCLKSISELDWPKQNLEVIVVDNGSTDNTHDIVKSFNAALLIDDTKPVSGLRNLGAMNAKGEILAFVDADCIVSSDWLKNASKYFDQKDVVIWGGPPVPPNHASWVQKAWFLMVEPDKTVQSVDWIGTIDLFVRKKTFEIADGFNEDLLTCEDVDFCYRNLKYGKIITDCRIKVIHLREADTVKQFFKKEIWRGSSNFRGVFSHGLSIKELPSLIVPIYSIFMLFCVGLFLWEKNGSSFFISSLFLSLPGVFAIFKIRKKVAPIKQRVQLCFLTYVYFFARAISLICRSK